MTQKREFRPKHDTLRKPRCRPRDSDQAKPDSDYGLAIEIQRESVDSIVHGSSEIEVLDQFANLTRAEYALKLRELQRAKFSKMQYDENKRERLIKKMNSAPKGYKWNTKKQRKKTKNNRILKTKFHEKLKSLDSRPKFTFYPQLVF